MMARVAQPACKPNSQLPVTQTHEQGDMKWTHTDNLALDFNYIREC